jgi:hypothetical protein
MMRRRIICRCNREGRFACGLGAPGVPRARQKRGLTQSEEDDRGEIYSGADKRR